jgi:hypothetical protein
MVKMNKNIIVMMMVLSLFASIVNVSAVSYFQSKIFIDNDRINQRASYFWDIGDLTSDHIKSGDKLQAYFYYDVYTAKWNMDNPDYSVDNCNLTIEFFDYFTGNVTIVYNQVFTGITEDVSIAKYFVEMDKGDGFNANFNCKFSGIRPELLEMPVTMSIVTPTWECKACQYYEWSKLEVDIQKAKTIGDNRVETMGYIKDLIILNYEFLIIFFWLFLFSIVWVAFSFIFIGIYWLYLYLAGVSKMR